MNIIEFENLIIKQAEHLLIDIITQNLYLEISAKSRAGAEISDYLEDKFIEHTLKHKYFFNSEKAPKGQTKNPWDIRTNFKLNTHTEEIWIDFKALKISSKDSNPDIGTPNKIIKFIKKGNFYILFVYVFYQEKNSGLEFVQNNDVYVKLYFLKDINHTFRRNPKNQLQVNISAPPEYRSREDFIHVLINKIKDSHIRQIKISEKQLKLLECEEKEMLARNKLSEEETLKKI